MMTLGRVFLVRILSVFLAFVCVEFAFADAGGACAESVRNQGVCSSTATAANTKRAVFFQAHKTAITQTELTTIESDIDPPPSYTLSGQRFSSDCVAARNNAFQMYLALKLELLSMRDVCAPTASWTRPTDPISPYQAPREQQVPTTSSVTATTTTTTTTITNATTTNPEDELSLNMLLVMVKIDLPEGTRCSGEPVAINGVTWGNLGSSFSRKKCTGACLVNPLCNAALFRSVDGQCTAFADCGGSTNETGFVLYVKESSSIVRLNESESSRCVDSLLGAESNMTLGDCSIKCLALSNCRFITTDSAGRCSLFKTCNQKVADETARIYVKTEDPVAHIGALDKQEPSLTLIQPSAVALPVNSVHVELQASVRKATMVADVALSCEAEIKVHPVWQVGPPSGTAMNGISEEAIAMAAGGTSCGNKPKVSVPVQIGGVTVSLVPLFSLLGTNFSIQKCENVNPLFRGFVWLQCVNGGLVPDVGRCFPAPDVLRKNCSLSRNQFEQSCSDAFLKLNGLMDSLTVNVSAQCIDDDPLQS